MVDLEGLIVENIEVEMILFVGKRISDKAINAQVSFHIFLQNNSKFTIGRFQV